MGPRRQSWQSGVRKTAKEREAECDEDDEVPEDAFMWNVPISPRPVQERSPAPSSCGSPPQLTQSPPTSRPVSLKDGASSSTAKTSPASSNHRFPQPPSPNSDRESFPPALERQRTWEETYTTLDADAKKLTEALEEYQTEIEHQEEIKRQQPGLSRSASLTSVESKPKAVPLPPIRKSDPLIDPFQPSEEKTKYLSRTRPSWLPPKDPKEEKKHLKEYQKMLARIEETGECSSTSLRPQIVTNKC
jgi:TBC1 domain family member 14